MSVIEMTRELAKAIQQDERYKRYMKACADNDTNTEIQNKIGEFNNLRASLSAQMQKPDKDADRLTSLDNEIKELYDEIMAMPTMVSFNNAKAEMDDLLESVNFIITSCANGDDPETCPERAPQSCTGSCSTCGGCH